jgi:uncharacterized cupin superfamily protein
METKLNYRKLDLGRLGSAGRATLRDDLGLTGAEISANRLGAGKEIPFVHTHKRNEEIYLVISGTGRFWLDGQVIPLTEGSAVRVDPAAQRCLKADASGDLIYFCIQVDQGSLVQATNDDGVIVQSQPSWV